jgi:TonB family protein
MSGRSLASAAFAIAALLGCDKTPASSVTPVASEVRPPPPPPVAKAASEEDLAGLVVAAPGAGEPHQPVRSGGPSKADGVVARNRWRFKSCYQRALAADPKAAGEVVLWVEVDEDGTVGKVTTARATVTATLEECVAAAARAMTFDPPARTIAYRVPVTFLAKL